MKTIHGEIRAPGTGDSLFTVFKTEVGRTKRIFTAHHHTSIEIAYFRRGGGTYVVSDRAYPIFPGDIFLFSADEMHYICDITDDIETLVLHFEPRFIWAPGDSPFDYSYLKVFFERGAAFENRVPGDTELAAALRAGVEDIDRECTAAAAHYALMVKIRLLTLLVTLLRACPAAPESAPVHTVSATGVGAVQSVLTYIGNHYTEDLTLSELAKDAGISRNYLSAVFKRLNGMTVWNYIQIKRVELAKGYLAETDRSVLEIAADCGFNTAANFNKAFKALTQKTPSGYRATHRAKTV